MLFISSLDSGDWRFKIVQKNIRKLLTPNGAIEKVWIHTVTKNKTMRTKTTLVAATILAAGLASSMAQANVYSLNVVGYVNANYVPGFNAAANPLVGSPDNTLNTVLAGTGVPDNTIVFTWDAAAQDFSPILPTYVAGTGTWTPNASVIQGQGFFVLAPTAFTHTWVGEVKQGTTTTPILPGFNGIASPAPIAGATPAVLAGMVPNDNDIAFKWDAVAQDFGATATYVAGTSSWTPVVNFGVGEGLFYLSTRGAAQDWVNTFTVAP